VGREYLATRLISGHDRAPAKTSWWPRHSRLSLQYMDALLVGQKSEVKAVESVVTRCSEEFETLFFGAPNFLMLEHSELELNLIDASLAGSPEKVTDIGAKLESNLRSIVKEFQERVPNFPSARYAYLLAQHVANFAAAVRLNLREEGVGHALIEASHNKNTVSLAGFTAEWCL
jgi:hypothetical protein